MAEYIGFVVAFLLGIVYFFAGILMLLRFEEGLDCVHDQLESWFWSCIIVIIWPVSLPVLLLYGKLSRSKRRRRVF